MNIEEQRDELGRLITRTHYFGPEVSGNCAREYFENEKMIEYCEFRGNLKTGLRKVYSTELPATLIEESLWQDDKRLEQRDYYLNGRLKSHVKYTDGELGFEATYSESGRETRKVTVGEYPALLFRDFHSQSQITKSEHLSLGPNLSVMRSFHVDGSVKSEKVILKRAEKGQGEIFIERNERGEVIQVEGESEDLLVYLLKPIPVGVWILIEAKKRIRMHGLKRIGEISGENLDAPLLNGWQRSKLQAVFYEDGLASAFFRNYDPDDGQIRTEFFKENEQLIFRDFERDHLGRLRTSRQMSRQVETQEWRGLEFSNLGDLIYEREILGFSRPAEAISPPAEVMPHGLSLTKIVDGEVVSSVTYDRGVMAGPSWQVYTTNGSAFRVEETLRANAVISRKVWQDGVLIIDQNFGQ